MTEDEPPKKSAHLEIRASRTARELQSLPPRTRADLGAVNELLLVLDGLVMGTEAVLDDEDTRHWSEKLNEVFEGFADVGATYGPRIAEFLVQLDEEGIERLAKKYARQGYFEHLHRMVGEAAFRRLQVAVSQDSDVVAAAAYRGVEVLMPYALAMQDLAGLLTEDEVSEVLDFNPAGGFMLEMVMALLDVLDVAVSKVSLPEHRERLESVRPEPASARDVIELTAQLRGLISGQSRELLRKVSSVLDRKLRGAKDAMAYSTDSASQAANSLVEFIDRLLQAAYTDADVLAWLDSNYTDVKGLKYEDKNRGIVRPTKRGQALCMMHGAQPVQTPQPILLLAATSLNVTRKQLQKIKHADQGSPEELKKVEDCLIAVEGFVQVGCRMAWAMLSDDTLADLRSRLDPNQQSEVEIVQGETA